MEVNFYEMYLEEIGPDSCIRGRRRKKGNWLLLQKEIKRTKKAPG